MGSISVDDDRFFLLTYHLKGSAGNEWQGDRLQFDVEWTLHQDNDDLGTAAQQPHQDTLGSTCGDNGDSPIFST